MISFRVGEFIVWTALAASVGCAGSEPDAHRMAVVSCNAELCARGPGFGGDYPSFEACVATIEQSYAEQIPLLRERYGQACIDAYVPSELCVHQRRLEICESGAAVSNCDPVYLASLDACSTPDQAPVAVAGADVTTPISANVFLDGRASYDAESSPLTFAWTIVDAPAGSTWLSATQSGQTLVFAPDLPGSYVVQLVVSDFAQSSLPDLVLVSVTGP